MAGKGDTPRPFSVDRKTFEKNWERVFKKHNISVDVTVKNTPNEVIIEIMPKGHTPMTQSVY